jgi:hypothetical protein
MAGFTGEIVKPPDAPVRKIRCIVRIDRRLYRLPGFNYRNCRADMEPFNGSFTK